YAVQTRAEGSLAAGRERSVERAEPPSVASREQHRDHAVRRGTVLVREAAAVADGRVRTVCGRPPLDDAGAGGRRSLATLRGAERLVRELRVEVVGFVVLFDEQLR